MMINNGEYDDEKDDDDENAAQVRAVRDLGEGDEITANYVDR